MKKNFDLHRLSMVLRWDILTNWQRHLGATAGLAMLRRIKTTRRWRLILIQPVQIRLTMMIMMRMIIDLFILNTV